MRAMSFIGAVCLTVFLSVSASALNQTVGEHTAVRMDLSYDLGPHGGTFEYASTQLGYRLDVIKNNSITDNPDVRVGNVKAALTKGYGLPFLHSHVAFYPGLTDAGIILVELYATSGARNTAFADYLANGYSSSDLLTFDVPKSGYTIYGIGMSSFLIAGVYTDRGSYVCVDGCNSNCLATAFVGHKAFIGYDYECQANVALNDVNTLYSNMAGWNGVSKRVLSQAWQGTTFAAPTGQTNVVLAPIVNATDLVEDGQLLNDRTFYVHFDCPMNTVVPLTDIIRGSGAIEVANIAWQGNDQISFTAKGRYRGGGRVIVASDTTTRNCCGARSWPANIGLDGNSDDYPGQNGHSPNGDDYLTSLVAMYGNPAAVITSLHAFRRQDGVSIEWRVELESSNTKTWLVERADDPVGPFSLVQEVPANGGPDYAAFDQGRTNGIYRLREVEGTGDTLSYEPTEVVDPFTPEADVPITVNTDSLLTAMMLEHQPLAPERVPETYVMTIIVPDSLKDVVQPLADEHSADGDFTDVTTLESVGGMVGLTSYLHTRATQGLQYVLYAGGSKYIAPWNDPLNWSPNRVGWNKSGQASYIAYPQWNILNFPFTVDPADSQAVSRAWWTSFSEDYQVVTDFDADSITDLRFGVLPANNRAELTLMVAKQIAAKRMPKSGSPMSNATFWCYGVTNGRNRGDVIVEFGDSLSRYFPTALTLQKLYATDAIPYTYAQREAMSVAAFNAGRGLFVNLGTFGNRSRNGWIDQVNGWSWSKTNATTVFPFYLGTNCGQMDDVRPYDPTYMAGYVKKAMVDLQHGFWGGCGPDAGSFLMGNFLFGKQFLLRAYSSGARSGGDASFLALRDVAFQHPEWKPLMQSYVYFGDPLIPLPEQVIRIVGVGDQSLPATLQLAPAYPNPSSGVAYFRFALPQAAEVAFSVHDVQGRVVRVLPKSRYSAGFHIVAWDGHDGAGKLAAPGMYLVRVTTGSETETQKMIRVR